MNQKLALSRILICLAIICPVGIILFGVDGVTGEDVLYDMPGVIRAVVPAGPGDPKQLACALAVHTLPVQLPEYLVDVCGKTYWTHGDKTYPHHVDESVTVVVHVGRITGIIYGVAWVKG